MGIELTDAEVEMLRGWLRGGKTERRLAERARIVLRLGEGATNVEIADELGVREATVSKWRGRFVVQRLSGLRDAARKGRPKIYGAETDKRILEKLDEPPPKGYSTWSGELLAEALGDVTARQVWRNSSPNPVWT